MFIDGGHFKHIMGLPGGNETSSTEHDTEAFAVRHLSTMKLIVLYVEKLPNYLNVLSRAD